jgi:soluble P-type ATPase
MQTIEIPDFGRLDIHYIVCDYNGTLAVDGTLLPGVADTINAIENIEVHVITADTFGVARKQLAATKCRLSIAPNENQALWKRDYIHSLGPDSVVAIGNGRNDRHMLEESALGIALIQQEGAAVTAVRHADIVCLGITDALAYFTNTRRLIATLRS